MKINGRFLFFCIILQLSTPSVFSQDTTAISQKKTDTVSEKPPRNFFRNEILAITENDNYTLQLRDGYYTNGIILRFSRALAIRQGSWFATPKISKVVQGYEAGQYILNPVRYDSINTATQDRPFAGYLYGKFDQRIFFQRNSLLQWSLALGTIGPHSYGEEVQRWYHHVVGIYDVKGWSGQLNNEVSVNLGVAYYKSLLRKPVQDRSIDITALGMANLGNAYTDLSGGMLFRFGLMENFSNSVHFSSRVTADVTKAPKHRNELYFFVQPMLTWQLYNATLQGGYFLDNKGPLTVETEPFYLTTQMGFKFALCRWTFGAHYVNRTLQATKQIRNENFLSFQVAYRMGDLLK